MLPFHFGRKAQIPFPFPKFSSFSVLESTRSSVDVNIQAFSPVSLSPAITLHQSVLPRCVPLGQSHQECFKGSDRARVQPPVVSLIRV